MRVGQAGRDPLVKPWIGREATGPDGVRWHVMGDSHYVTPDSGYREGPDLTRDVVLDWALQPSRGSAFFTRVAAIVLNQEPGSFDRSRAWHSFAFSNFAQQVVGGPRQSPTKIMWEEARACFFGQLAVTRPEVLIVLGDRAWQQLPENIGGPIPPFRFEVQPDWPAVEDAWFYPHRVAGQVHGTVAVKVVHPSAGGGYWKWKIAASRAHTAAMCHSNILEWARGHIDQQ